MKLKFTGPAHNRSFTKADFSRHGIDQEAVKFNADNNFVAEVSDEAGAWLIENEAPEFRVATDDDETEQDLTRVGTPSRAMGKLPASVADSIGASGSGPQAPATPAGSRGKRT